MNAVTNFSQSQLATIKNTVARDANAAEFDQFMAACKGYGLDPFRRQISLVIYNKDKPDRRSHAIIVGRDGLRAIAQRCGDYRPATEAASFVIEEGLKSPSNPAGIISCSIKLWKQDSKGDWYEVFGEAYWDEFAPISEEWAYDQEAGRRKPTGKMAVSGNWEKMPRLMIQKCAEAQALRAGWPDQFGGIYVEEEMEAAEMRDVTPSQELNEYAAAKRQEALGGPSILFVMDPAKPMVSIPVGEVADRVIEATGKLTTMQDVQDFMDRNNEALRQFWGAEPGDALTLKQHLEGRIEALGKDAA